VAAGALLETAVVGDVAQVEAAAPGDVLHGVPRPGTLGPMADVVAVEPLGDLLGRAVCELGPDATDDVRLRLDDLQGPRTHVRDRPVAEGVEASVAAGLEDGPGLWVDRWPTWTRSAIAAVVSTVGRPPRGSTSHSCAASATMLVPSPKVTR
jgi:hypothetical protein